MKLKSSKIPTSTEYITFVEQFSGLVSEELRLAALDLRQGDSHAVARVLPALISLVNTIGYLRGQDEIFLTVRPQTPRHQDALYANEIRFEAILQDLIDAVLDSSEADYYKKRLTEYFIDARAGKAERQCSELLPTIYINLVA